MGWLTIYILPGISDIHRRRITELEQRWRVSFILAFTASHGSTLIMPANRNGLSSSNEFAWYQLVRVHGSNCHLNDTVNNSTGNIYYLNYLMNGPNWWFLMALYIVIIQNINNYAGHSAFELASVAQCNHSSRKQKINGCAEIAKVNSSGEKPQLRRRLSNWFWRWTFATSCRMASGELEVACFRQEAVSWRH